MASKSSFLKKLSKKNRVVFCGLKISKRISLYFAGPHYFASHSHNTNRMTKKQDIEEFIQSTSLGMIILLSSPIFSFLFFLFHSIICRRIQTLFPHPIWKHHLSSIWICLLHKSSDTNRPSVKLLIWLLGGQSPQPQEASSCHQGPAVSLMGWSPGHRKFLHATSSPASAQCAPQRMVPWPRQASCHQPQGVAFMSPAAQLQPQPQPQQIVPWPPQAPCPLQPSVTLFVLDTFFKNREVLFFYGFKSTKKKNLLKTSL